MYLYTHTREIHSQLLKFWRMQTVEVTLVLIMTPFIPTFDFHVLQYDFIYFKALFSLHVIHSNLKCSFF